MSDDQKKLEDAGFDVEQANSATLIMSKTGNGKSSLLASLYRWVWNEYKKKSIHYLFDGGGIPMDLQALVYTGQVHLFRARTRDPFGQGLMWDTVIKCCQGWFPTRIRPRSGEAEVGCAMMPPVEVVYTITCPNGHPVAKVTHASQVRGGMCPTCNTIVNDMNWKVASETIKNTFFADIGAVGLDSLTQMLAWGEEDLAQRAGRDDLKGMDGAIGGKVISGDQKLGQTTMSHIGFAQQQARSLVLMSNGIPGLVVPAVFTALTMDAMSEGMRQAGPELSGRKKTTVAGAWFGNVWEPERINVGRDDQGRPKYQFILHLEQWVDAEEVTHLCKNRASAGYLPSTLSDPPLTNTKADKDTAFTGFNLGVAFTMLNAALEERIHAGMKEFGQTHLAEADFVSYERPATAVPHAMLGAVGPGMPVMPGGMVMPPMPFAIGPVGAAGAPQVFKPVMPPAAATTPFVPIGGPAAPLATLPSPTSIVAGSALAASTVPANIPPAVRMPPPVVMPAMPQVKPPVMAPATLMGPAPPAATPVVVGPPPTIAAPPGRLPPPAMPVAAPKPS